MALDPGANPAPTFADIRQRALVQLQKPRERFKTGYVIPGTDITSMGGLQVISTGRPNEFRVMHTLANNELIAILGPQKASSFNKSGDAAGNFKITNGRELRAAKAVASSAVSVAVAAVNAQGEVGSTRTFTLFIDPKAPTDVALSATTIAAAAAVDAVVGNLTSTDPEAGDTFTYAVRDNDFPTTPRFKISSAQLLVARALTTFAGTSASIAITTTDAAGLAFTKNFTITIT